MTTNFVLIFIFLMFLHQEDGSLGWQIGFTTAGLIIYRIFVGLL